MNTPDKPQAYTERDLIELACRAPAVPEWFEPTLPEWEPGELPVSQMIERQRIIQWPKAYARMVLEAK